MAGRFKDVLFAQELAMPAPWAQRAGRELLFNANTHRTKHKLGSPVRASTPGTSFSLSAQHREEGGGVQAGEVKVGTLQVQRHGGWERRAVGIRGEGHLEPRGLWRGRVKCAPPPGPRESDRCRAHRDGSRSGPYARVEAGSGQVGEAEGRPLLSPSRWPCP